MDRQITHKMPDCAEIVIIGSSTTFGAHDEEGLGWAARFNSILAKNHTDPRWLVANCGVSGHSMLEGYMNLCTSVALHKPQYVIVALGTNDIAVAEGTLPESARLSLTKSLLSFISILDYVKLNNLKTLIIGPQPVENDVVRFKAHNDRLEGHTSFRYENAKLKEYNDHLEAICARENIPFLRLFEDWQFRSGLWADGLHPNAKGHQLWAEQVYSKFVSLYL